MPNYEPPQIKVERLDPPRRGWMLHYGDEYDWFLACEDREALEHLREQIDRALAEELPAEEQIP
jgi:hypothetical protein